MKKYMGDNKIPFAIMLVSGICSLIVFFWAVLSMLLPTKYIVAAIILLILIYVVLIWMHSRKSKKLIVSSVIIECVIILFSMYALSFLWNITNMMSRITQTVIETDSISAYVMQDSAYQVLEDTVNCSYGTVKKLSEKAVGQVLHELEESLNMSLQIVSYEDMFLAADALKADEIQVLVINDAYADLIPEYEGYEWFAQDTRIIGNSLEEVEVTVWTGWTRDEAVNEPESSEPQEEASGSEEINKLQEEKSQEDIADSMERMEPAEQVDWEALVNQNIAENPEGTFIVYISGIDIWGNASTRSRSDTNILAVINTNTKKILLISTPRDYYVPLSVSKGAKDKLTHAGIYGINVSVETLEMLYGVDINYYIRMNFTGFTGIIDALGGIDVYSGTDFSVGDVFYYKQGMNHLSGIEALAFARERYSFAGGDRTRGVNQMEVIKAAVNKSASLEILYRYADVMNAASGCFSTNMSQNKIASLVRMQLNDLSGWTITSMSVDGTNGREKTYSIPTMSSYVMIPDESTVQKTKDSIEAVLQGK